MLRSRPPTLPAPRPQATTGLPWRIAVAVVLSAGPSLAAQETTTDVAYVADGHPRHVLDIARSAGVPARALSKADSNHRRLNDDLGRDDDPIAATWLEFLEDPVGTARPTQP